MKRCAAQPRIAGMTNEPFERDFRRFRATRDPGALAAVFDAVAPRLLLVAMHLVRDAATAEDLVQSVFLQVLRDVDRFDPQRPVLPWLLGMLEHRASDLRQRAHVRRERADLAVLAAASPMAGGPTPANAAALSEVRERVAEAIAGMPADYRTVLTLRLVHGLAPVDIAHAHGLSPATVRTRMRRGLELLRAALPRGLAAPGLAALLAAELLRAGDGLAAVRAKVLLAAAGTSAVGIGSWLSALAALVLLIVGVVVWRPSDAPASVEVPPSAPAAVVASERPADTPSDRGDEGRRVAANLASSATQLDPRTSTVRGRCVDEHGQPLAGVLVSWHVMRASRDPAHGEDADRPFEPPPPVRTGDDGTFSFSYEPPPLREIQLVCTSAHHVEEYVDVGELRTGVELDAGDVSMPSGTRVRLRLVVGERALAATSLMVHQGQKPGARRLHGPSDDDGWIDLGVLRAGTWHHEVETPYLDQEGEVVVPAQRDPYATTIVLREPPRERAIAGVLVDIAGQPVRGVELALPAPGVGSYVAKSEPDGRFVWAFPPTFSAPDELRLALWRASPEFELLDDGGPLALGRSDVRVVVRRRARSSLRVRVVDTDGVPVPRFGLRCWPDPWRLRGIGSHPSFVSVPVEAHDGGVALLANLQPGPCLVSVFAEPPFAEAAEIPCDLPEGRETDLQVVLRPPAELIVDIVNADNGLPRSGVQVQLAKVVPSDATVDLTTFRTEVARARRGGGSSSGANVLVFTSATSGADGVVHLRAPANTPGLVLIAGGDGCQPHLQSGIALPPEGARVQLPVVAAGRVQGRLVPPAFVEHFGPDPEKLLAWERSAVLRHVDRETMFDAYPCIVLRPAGRVVGSTVVEQRVARDGSFELGGVPPGRYEVWVCVSTMHVATELGPLQTIDVGIEDGPMLQLDATRWLPGRFELVLACDGAPRAGRGGLVRLDDDDSSVRRIELDVDQAGRMRSPWLLPGRYLPFLNDDSVTISSPRRALPVHAESALVLAAGAQVQQTVFLQRRSLALTIVDERGAARAGIVLHVEAIDRPELPPYPWRGLCTGDDGRVSIPVVPTGRLRIWQQLATGGDAEQGRREIGIVAADATAATLVLQ